MNADLESVSIEDLVAELKRRMHEVDSVTSRALIWSKREGAVLKTVAQTFGITPGDLFKSTRRTRIVSARWTVFELLARRGHTQSEIGEIFGLNYSTVGHGLRQLRAHLDGASAPDSEIRRLFHLAETELK